MRDSWTVGEQRIVDRLEPIFDTYKIDNASISDTETDSPDVVINHENGRFGIEITRLDYEDFCKWSNTAPQPPYARAAEVTINLEKMLASTLSKKKAKYETYKRQRKLDECWLILHNNVFEFKEVTGEGHPDKEWFEEFSFYELQERNCPFDKVLFNLEHPDLWYELYDKKKRKRRRAIITRWPSVILRECAITALEPKVYNLDFTDNVPREEFE